jgi:hypothetical protein
MRRAGGEVCFAQVFRDGRGEQHINNYFVCFIFPSICESYRLLYPLYKILWLSGLVGIVDYTNYDDMKYAVCTSQ